MFAVIALQIIHVIQKVTFNSKCRKELFHSAFIQPATLEFRHSLNLTYLTVLVAFLVIICDIGASSRP